MDVFVLFYSDLNNQNHFIVALSLTAVGNVASVRTFVELDILVERREMLIVFLFCFLCC